MNDAAASDARAAALAALLGDENRRFPPHPRLIDDVRVFHMPDGLGVQFHAGDAPLMVRGASTERVLQFLLPALDGTRHVEQLVDGCPGDVGLPTLVKTLLLLHTKGLLAEGGHGADTGVGVTPADPVLHRQRLFWGRHIGVTRSADSGTEVQRRLEGTRVALVGSGTFGACTFDLLSRSGCTDLRVLAWDDDGGLVEAASAGPCPPTAVVDSRRTDIDAATAALRAWIDDVDLVVTATRNAPVELFHAVNRICLRYGRRWLRANIDVSAVDVGPFVDPHASACFACVELRRRSLLTWPIEDHLAQLDLALERPSGATPPVGEALFVSTWAASLVVGEVVRIATGVAMPTLLNTVLRLSPLTGNVERNTVLRVPRCEECFVGAVDPLAAGVG